jgi:hypothetical protein
MPSLSLEIDTSKMATSSKMFRMVAGVENLYYLLLLSGDHARAKNADTWRSWHQLGFHMNVKNPPPAVRVGERITVTLDISVEPNMIIRAEGGIAQTVSGLQSLMGEIDRLRGRHREAGDAARLAAVRADSAIAGKLLDPVHNALNNSGCALLVPDFDFAINRALTAFTSPEITSLRARLA